ncbi:MAG: HipA N-terminal domain-containing protein [Rikenellaceae bacterium]|jgi:serine/threonine-protein kinase HipA|nr:HipA N-terminal domain-containing protein [Rikenellaceae bacterium]
MREAEIYVRGERAGILSKSDNGEYMFRYDDGYFADPSKPAVSLTLGKVQQEYRSPILFPFFFNMLSEGNNRIVQSRLLHIDENDHFEILLATARIDTIGAVTVIPLDI